MDCRKPLHETVELCFFVDCIAPTSILTMCAFFVDNAQMYLLKIILSVNYFRHRFVEMTHFLFLGSILLSLFAWVKLGHMFLGPLRPHYSYVTATGDVPFHEHFSFHDQIFISPTIDLKYSITSLAISNHPTIRNTRVLRKSNCCFRLFKSQNNLSM